MAKKKSKVKNNLEMTPLMMLSIMALLLSMPIVLQLSRAQESRKVQASEKRYVIVTPTPSATDEAELMMEK